MGGGLGFRVQGWALLVKHLLRGVHLKVPSSDASTMMDSADQGCFGAEREGPKVRFLMMMVVSLRAEVRALLCALF